MTTIGGERERTTGARLRRAPGSQSRSTFQSGGFLFFRPYGRHRIVYFFFFRLHRIVRFFRPRSWRRSLRIVIPSWHRSPQRRNHPLDRVQEVVNRCAPFHTSPRRGSRPAPALAPSLLEVACEAPQSGSHSSDAGSLRGSNPRNDALYFRNFASMSVAPLCSRILPAPTPGTRQLTGLSKGKYCNHGEFWVPRGPLGFP